MTALLSRRLFLQALAASVVAAGAALPMGFPRGYPKLVGFYDLHDRDSIIGYAVPTKTIVHNRQEEDYILANALKSAPITIMTLPA